MIIIREQVPAFFAGYRRFALVAVIAGAAMVPAQADINTNGTFLGVPGGAFTTLFAGDSSINGWTVTSGSVDWINTYWGAPIGNSIDMDGDYAAESLVFTATGPSTTLTFESLDCCGSPYGPAIADVSVNEDIAATPEPSFYGILGLGLAGLVNAVRRRKGALV
jgi:hypothetical protein